VKRPYGTVYLTDRDWIRLSFSLKDKDSIGTWKCIDGFSDYTKQPRYDLADHYPNVQDDIQDCNVIPSLGSQQIANDRIYATI